MALCSLKELAKIEKFSLGSYCLEANTYIDDTFSGADELSDAIREKQELIEILCSAGSNLTSGRKSSRLGQPSAAGLAEHQDVADETIHSARSELGGLIRYSVLRVFPRGRCG